MEGMKGDELLPMLRPRLPEHTKIVMASTSSVVHVHQLLSEGGADGYLVKPIAPDVIAHVWQYVYPPFSSPVPARSSAQPRSSVRWADRETRNPPRGDATPQGATTPSGAVVAAPAERSGRSSGVGANGHVHTRLREAGPAARLRPIRLRPEDDSPHDIGLCKQQ